MKKVVHRPFLFRVYPGEYLAMLQTYEHQVFDFSESQYFNTNSIDLDICLKELAAIEAKLASNPSFFLVNHEVTKELDDIAHTEKQPYSHPRTLVLMAIVDTTSKWLVSGNHHIGRGMLDETGQDLLAIFDYALTELQENGDYTEEDAVHIRDFTYDLIKNNGVL